MPPKGERGRKEGKTSREKPPTLEEFTLTSALLEEDASVLKEREVIEEYELERRYTLGRALTAKALAKLETRHILQRFVTLKDKKGKEITYRLRITDGEEGRKYRIARKERVGALFGKKERQIQFTPNPDDPRTKEHETLWKLSDSRVIERQRYYLDHLLYTDRRSGEEHFCTIHYEIWKGGPEDGFVRIEVEFKDDPDELYYEKNGARKLLPDWIGEDVTDDPRYRAKNITAVGLPKEALKKLAKKK